MKISPLCFILSGALSVLLPAQTPPGADAEAKQAPAPALSLTAALQQTATHNPALNAAGYGGRAAEALAAQAALRPNPTLDVMLENFAGTGRRRGADDLEATVQASQVFERGDKRGKRVAVAQRDHEVAARELAVQRAAVLAATAVAYVETLAGQQRLALAAEPLQLAAETVAAAEARVKAGDASPAEPARARAALAAARMEHARAESALTRARATLAALWGGHPTDVPALNGVIQVPDTLPDENTFLASLAHHPKLALQQALIASRRASMEWQQAQAVPDITASGGLRFLREGTDAAFVAGVSVPLPVRHKNQGNIRAARENLAGAEQSLPAVENALRAEFTVVWQELTAAHAAVQNLRGEALPATTEAHAVVRRAYAEGQLPLIDVLDAQRALVALRRELLEAEAAYALALVRIEGLTTSDFPVTAATLSSP
jgi:cobalt-zinc-cadmium efflux system outer membrane protein